jgi:hypothetical protein
VSLSDLIRWSGLLAVVAAALFIIADLVTVVSAFGEGSMGGLLFRAALSSRQAPGYCWLWGWWLCTPPKRRKRATSG